LGMEYILDALSPLENNSKFQTYPPKGRRPDEMVDDRMTEEELVEQAKVREDQDNQDTQRKISQLMKLYNAKIKNPNEQGNEALESALEERVDVINAAQANKWTKQPTKTYVDDFNERGESDFRTTLKNPDVPSFGEIGSSNPPINKYTPFNTNLDDSMVQELVGSFFGKRDFNLGNVLNLKDTLRSVANNALLSTANSAFNSVANGLQIDGSSLIQSPTNPIKKPLMTGTTEKAFKIPTSETVNIINTGNHSGVSKVIKTWNGSGPE